MAESGLTLPAFSLFALCIWRPWQFSSLLDALPLVLTFLTGYVLMEWCNRRQVIRIRSRLTTSLFLLGVSVLYCLAPCGVLSLAIALGVACSLLCLTACYDRREPVVDALHASFAISAVSLMMPAVLLMVPATLFCMAAYMRAFSLRTFSASIMGLLLPCVACGTWMMVCGDFDAVFSVRLETTTGGLASWIPWLVVTALGAVSLIHYLMHSYDDKIRVRMIFYCVIILWAVMQAVAILSMQHVHMLLPALWLLACPMLAHHVALSSSWWALLWFTVIMSALMCGAIFVVIL